MNSRGQTLAGHLLTGSGGTAKAFTGNDLKVRPLAGLTEG
jgi:hypothetical protein